MRKFTLYSVFFVLFLAVFVGVATYIYAPKLYELRVNIQKYTTINVPKNKGLKKQILVVLHNVAEILPTPTFIELVRNADSIGTNFPVIPYPKASTQVMVTNSAELMQVLEGIHGDTEILLLNGRYHISLNKVPLKRLSAGSIILKGESAASVQVMLDSVEGFVINSPDWVIENITLVGKCDFDSKCAHAIHLAGNADNVIIQNNIFKNFNAHIKSNGVINTSTEIREFPDQVKIINNTFANDWVRDTQSPVTPIDVVGGNNWLIAGNFIADFAKKRGNKVSYGAFLKGAGKNGQFENNIVACEYRVPHTGPTDVRIGLSFGGGGTGATVCQDEACSVEHSNGKMTNNLVVNCSNDVAIYVNKSQTIQLQENILLNSLGIDVRFAQSSAIIQDNRLHGFIRSRDGANINMVNNKFQSLYEGIHL